MSSYPPSVLVGIFHQPQDSFFSFVFVFWCCFLPLFNVLLAAFHLMYHNIPSLLPCCTMSLMVVLKKINRLTFFPLLLVSSQVHTTFITTLIVILLVSHSITPSHSLLRMSNDSLCTLLRFFSPHRQLLLFTPGKLTFFKRGEFYSLYKLLLKVGHRQSNGV